jgi:hypothetical protein
MRFARLATLLVALGAMSGCREEAPAPFSPRFLPHDGGVDAGDFDPPNTGASTGGPSLGSSGSSTPTVSDEGCVSSFSDSFNAGINDRVWTRVNDCRATVTAASDQVRMSLTGGCGFSDTALVLKDAFLCGDFEVAVDYRMPDWNPVVAGTRWATLFAHEPDSPNSIAIERLGGRVDFVDCREDADVYIGWGDATSVCHAKELGDLQETSAITGRLRIKRAGSTVSAHIGNGAPLAEAEAGTAPMRLLLIAGTTSAAHLVLFDNITVTTRR